MPPDAQETSETSSVREKCFLTHGIIPMHAGRHSRCLKQSSPGCSARLAPLSEVSQKQAEYLAETDSYLDTRKIERDGSSVTVRQ